MFGHLDRSLSPQERQQRIRAATHVATIAAVVVFVSCIASIASVWFVILGTGAEAVISAAIFYAAYEAFDERIRRRPD